MLEKNIDLKEKESILWKINAKIKKKKCKQIMPEEKF